MIELFHKTILWIHIPFGFLSLVLFWIPVGVKKGSTVHRKVGWYYYIAMWVVLITSGLLSISNTIQGNYIAALYLGYLTLITSNPLWYSYEILKQKGEWSDRYFMIRKVFLAILFICGIGMILLGAIKFNFQGMGTMMVFFGLLVMPAGIDLFRSKAVAMSKERRIKMHIQGMIISGIAAYTAFFAFGGSRILMGMLHLPQQWMILAWTLPSVLGLGYSWYMKKKYRPHSSSSYAS